LELIAFGEAGYFGAADAAGLLGCWVAGLLGCWVAGLLGCWVAGLLGCWVMGAAIAAE
jgi:hypothetical protein